MMLVTVMGVALALAQPVNWGLEWQGPGECRAEAEVKEAVEARLHRAVFGGDAKFIVVGVVSREASGWRAHITLRDPSGVMLGTRDVSSDEPACTSLDSRVTLVVALLIDPSASLRTPVVKQAEAPVLQPFTEPESEALRAQLFAAAPGEVSVTLEGDAPGLELFRLVEGPVSKSGRPDSGYVSACIAPCSKLLPSADLYLVGGEGVRPSAAFHLLDEKAVRVQVKAGSLNALLAAVTLVTLGTISAIGGSVGLGLAAQNTSEAGPGLVGLALGATLAGVASLAGGVVLISSTSTEVKVTPLR